MEIYIEIFLIQNILINFCLLKLIYLTTKSKTSFFKLLLASLIGAIPSVFCVMFLSNTTLLNLTKFLTAIAMIACAFQQNKKQFVFNFILLFLFTFAFNGIVMTLSSKIHITSFGAVVSNKLSLELICVLFIIFTYIFELVVKHLKLKIHTNNLIFNITLSHKGKTLKTQAYLDTGNFLNENGEPILVLDLNTYLRLSNINLISFLTSQPPTIQTSTVNGTNSLKIFEIDKLIIKNGKKEITFEHQKVAVNTTNCFKNTNYQALLSPLFL